MEIVDGTRVILSALEVQGARKRYPALSYERAIHRYARFLLGLEKSPLWFWA